MNNYKHAHYMIRSSDDLTNEDCQAIVSLLNITPKHRNTVLSGRYGVVAGELSDGQKIVVKGYRRGGILRYFISQHYLGVGQTRAEQEYGILKVVKGLGCQVPYPVASVRTGYLFQRVWLVMKDVDDHKTLAQISLEDVNLIYDLIPQVGKQIIKLIDAGIFHVDLHPGNVLVTPDSTCTLIDFDKAHYDRGKKSLLRDKYLLRWRRAVIKHSLPEVLSELLSAELRVRIDK